MEELKSFDELKAEVAGILKKQRDLLEQKLDKIVADNDLLSLFARQFNHDAMAIMLKANEDSVLNLSDYYYLNYHSYFKDLASQDVAEDYFVSLMEEQLHDKGYIVSPTHNVLLF